MPFEIKYTRIGEVGQIPGRSAAGPFHEEIFLGIDNQQLLIRPKELMPCTNGME